MFLNTHQIIGLIFSFLLLIFVIEMVRRRKLLEGYSLLWIFTSVILIIISFWQNLWEKIALLLGIVYGPLILLIFVSLFLVIICLDFSIKISKLTQQVRSLIQKIAILEKEIEENVKKNKKHKRN